MSFRLLCTADIHLGRRPSRVPEGLDGDSLGPAAAWRAVVEAAIQQKVDAVALTGDVVHENGLFCEAFTVFHVGVERLVRAGIPIVAVAGNHDFDVLPALAEQFPDRFHLLGRGGRWEQVVLQRPGTPGICVQGWSFPSGHVSASPLAGYTPPTAGDLPTIALLHCDCDASPSTYAPVTSFELKVLPPAAWLLGHIHQSRHISEHRPLILYPGSPVGMDIGEPGPHGPWLVTLAPGCEPTAEMLPLAPLRWERIDLPLTGIATELDFGSAVTKAIQARHQQIGQELAAARVVNCRLRLTGRSPLHRQLPQLSAKVREELRPALDGVGYFIEKIEDLSQPDISLEEIARSHDPAGLLAERLLTLDRRQPVEAYDAIIRQAGAAVAEQRSQPVFASLPDSGQAPDEEHVRDLLLRAGMTVLEDLLAQKEPQP